MYHVMPGILKGLLLGRAQSHAHSPGTQLLHGMLRRGFEALHTKQDGGSKCRTAVPLRAVDKDCLLLLKRDTQPRTQWLKRHRHGVKRRDTRIAASPPDLGTLHKLTGQIEDHPALLFAHAKLTRKWPPPDDQSLMNYVAWRLTGTQRPDAPRHPYQEMKRGEQHTVWEGDKTVLTLPQAPRVARQISAPYPEE